MTWRGRELSMLIGGYCWWAKPESGAYSEGKAVFVFSDLREGTLQFPGIDPDDDEALEDFDLEPVAGLAWAQPADWTIFSSGPVSSPMQLYERVEDYLRNADAIFDAGRFLNQAEDRRRFEKIARSTGCMIGRGPAVIRDLICAELDCQDVPHNVVANASNPATGFLVRLGSSAFICSRAEFELLE